MTKFFKPKIFHVKTVADELLIIKGDTQLLSATHTGKEFDNIIIAYVESNDGKRYDVLFPSDEDALPIAEIKDTVTSLGLFFDKTFVKAIHEGISCLACEN